MAHTVTLIPGDATGPEIATAVQRIIAATGISIDWDLQPLQDGAIPPAVLESIRRHRVALMGYHVAHRDQSVPPPIVRLRKELGLFANLRPVRTLKGLPQRHEDLDLIIIREITEDVYAHLEHESIPGVFESLKVTTRAACERIIRYAFEYARANGRKKVTIVHKSNIMKRSDGLFLKVGREIAAQYTDIANEEVIVDALCMKLVLNPGKFDVLVTGNLYGDIVADLTAGLAGGASNCPSINVGEEQRVFAAARGDGPDHRGPDQGNLLTLLVPAMSMLKHLGETEGADRILRATEAALASGTLPYALGGSAGTGALTAAICGRLG
jgi:isocitrate dehydrogenase (NAD+)